MSKNFGTALVCGLLLCPPTAVSAQYTEAGFQQIAANSAILCNASQLNPATMVHLYMSRATGEGFASDGNVYTESQGNGGRITGYTRIRIAYQPCAATQRDYVSERRQWVDRFFLGKHAEKVLTIDAHITPLDVSTTRSLASIVRDSTKKGEEWSTQVDNDVILLPYFRADRSTVIDLEVKLHSTRDYSSTIAAASLDIVQRAAKLINPTTALITAANKDRFNEGATFVDTAVNGLLKVQVDESVRQRVPLLSAGGGQVLAVITLHLPQANDSYPSAKLPQKIVGQWVIYAEPVRQSMLDDVAIGNSVRRKNVTASTVLNYLVDDKKTLREALSGVQSLVTARDALVKANDGDVEDKARSLCRVVADQALSLGLTPVDAGAAAWAYLVDLSLPRKAMSSAETGCNDVDYYPHPS